MILGNNKCLVAIGGISHYLITGCGGAGCLDDLQNIFWLDVRQFGIIIDLFNKLDHPRAIVFFFRKWVAWFN